MCAGVMHMQRQERVSSVSYHSLPIPFESFDSGSLPEHVGYSHLVWNQQVPPVPSLLRAGAPCVCGDLLLYYMSSGIQTPVLMISEQASTFDSQATSPVFSGFFHPDKFTIKINTLLGCHIE